MKMFHVKQFTKEKNNMNYDELFKFLHGKVGEIYTARKGTVTVFIVDGTKYMINNYSQNGRVIENPADAYWIHSIDFSGSFSAYYTFGMIPPETPTYDIEPIVPLTDANIKKLKERFRNDSH